MRLWILSVIIILPYLLSAQSNRPNRTEFVKYPGSRQKKEERIYKDNKLVQQKEWYEDGTNKLRKSYTRQGKKHGKWIEWYSNGVKKYEIVYSNDSIIGTVYEWYESGNVKYEKIYEDNWLVKLRYFNVQKYLEYEEIYHLAEGYTEKITYEWYFNNKKKVVKHYKDGQLYKGEFYYPNGQLRLLESYYFGKVDGLSVEYYENGTKKTEKLFDKGTPVKFTEYDENGRVKKIVVHGNLPQKKKK